MGMNRLLHDLKFAGQEPVTHISIVNCMQCGGTHEDVPFYEEDGLYYGLCESTLRPLVPTVQVWQNEK